MNIAAWCLRNRTVTLVLTAVTLVVGIGAYLDLPRLEDPEFTIKDALVVTPYPGASAAEVEQEVTDAIELAVQQLGQVREIRSRSERGLSTVTVRIADRFGAERLPQVWDELRRKVGDARRNLPPGGGPSLVVDDYGDVYGVFFAVYGPEYSYAELKRFVDFLRRELLLVQDVARIATFGERQEAVYVELQRDRMARLGIPPAAIADELRKQNLVADAGRVRVGSEFIAISPEGGLTSVEDFGAIMVGSGSGQSIRLRDVAEIRRGYVEPPDHLLRYDGHVAIGLGIATVSGGNVVTMGAAVRDRLAELHGEIPLGIEIGVISEQSEAVTKALAGFVSSLRLAVVIVIVVLLFFMGLRSGLLIGTVLVVTIAGTFIFLAPQGVALERISLGALIIALGMLVDNAIVVVDGVLVRLERGHDAESAAVEVVGQSALPLLGATIIAILAFAAIGTSDDNTGEFCRSLFQVVLTSLLFSWVTAMTVTPVLCVLFLQPGRAVDVAAGAPQPRGLGGAYRTFLVAAMRWRWLTIPLVLVLFVTSVWGFRFVKQSFFPPSTRPQFLVDIWMPQGTHIDATSERVALAEKYVRDLPAVTHVTSFIGRGGLRFLLTYAPERQNGAYGQLVVDVAEGTPIAPLLVAVETELGEALPDAQVYASKFQLGPGSTGKIQVRLRGPDADVLRRLAEDVEEVLHADANTKGIRSDWRQRVKVIRPRIAAAQAKLTGVDQEDIAATIAQGFSGLQVGVYREGNLLLPILLRAQAGQRDDVGSIRNLQVWSPAARRMIPLRQVVASFDTGFEDEIIQRRDRKRTITLYADPEIGPASVVFERLRPQIEAIPRPPGYALEWGGEAEDSGRAQAALFGPLPAFVLAMVLVTIVLFNSLRQTIVIWACVPLAVIGVTLGLLVTGQPFGFMALLGFLSLMGMLIKNAVVLVDEINLQSGQGKPAYAAVVDSGVSRLRPVTMAASTTALGMVPLLSDGFFAAMAVTIISGLMFATLLTMVVLPVLYGVVFRVPSAAE